MPQCRTSWHSQCPNAKHSGIPNASSLCIQNPHCRAMPDPLAFPMPQCRAFCHSQCRNARHSDIPPNYHSPKNTLTPLTPKIAFCQHWITKLKTYEYLSASIGNTPSKSLSDWVPAPQNSKTKILLPWAPSPCFPHTTQQPSPPSTTPPPSCMKS